VHRGTTRWVDRRRGVAKVTFVALLVKGRMSGELGSRGLALFATLGAAVWILLAWWPNGADWMTPALAVSDIALVFAAFKGGLRIS
jgi:hypothetical protein